MSGYIHNSKVVYITVNSRIKSHFSNSKSGAVSTTHKANREVRVMPISNNRVAENPKKGRLY